MSRVTGLLRVAPALRLGASIVVYIIILATCSSVVIAGSETVPSAEPNPMWSTVHVGIRRFSENSYVRFPGAQFSHIGFCQGWWFRYGALLFVSQKNIHVIRSIWINKPTFIENMGSIGIVIDKAGGAVTLLDCISFANLATRSERSLIGALICWPMEDIR
jgi:hypothetical protein